MQVNSKKVNNFVLYTFYTLGKELFLFLIGFCLRKTVAEYA